MKVIKFSPNEEHKWLAVRCGKITGTRLKDLIVKRGTKPKKGFYQIIAERVAIPHDEGESYLDRGKRLEDEAMERFEKETGKKVDKGLVFWQREDYPDIAITPDGAIGKTEAVEVKCRSSAEHIEAFLTREVPAEYEYQVIQYFVVNDSLKKLYFVFYDPNMPKDFFYLEVNRKDIADKVKECFDLQVEMLKRIEEIEKQLTF